MTTTTRKGSSINGKAEEGLSVPGVVWGINANAKLLKEGGPLPLRHPERKVRGEGEGDAVRDREK
jgi:hypothetical protein